MISRCDPQLGHEPLKFTYLLRGLDGRPVSLTIVSDSFPCPRPRPDNDFGSLTRTARFNFRARMNEEYGTALVQGVKQNLHDWRAYFTLYDEELARLLEGTAEDVERIRVVGVGARAIRAGDPVGSQRAQPLPHELPIVGRLLHDRAPQRDDPVEILGGHGSSVMGRL
jgi:hypothetical protein